MRELIIGTRGSALAMWQAGWVADQMKAKVSGLRVRIEKIKTAGDLANKAPLWEIGGTGLFVRELERALMDGKVDVAVHSMKDLPSVTGTGLTVAAVPERADPRDVLVSRHGLRLESLPNGARVGTSSTRRKAQLLAYRRDLQIVPLRGNVDTRLRKAETEQLDAIVLAAAGLLRLGRSDQATEFLSPEI
ncbi:MAG: hydroxymethylbilane synthase, partial [Chloroflexota bacterium]